MTSTYAPITRPRRTLGSLAAVVALVVGACSTGTAALTQVDPTGAEELITSEPGLVVLDIRTPEEVATGTLPDAIDIDFYAPSFEADIAELDRDTPYLVYCRSGNRSDSGVELMQELGFTQIYELENGIVSWVESGRPLS